MNLKTLTIRHIRLISLCWSRNAVRSGSGLVYLLIALIFGLTVAHVLITPVEQLIAEQKRATGKRTTYTYRHCQEKNRLYPIKATAAGRSCKNR